MNDSLHFQPRSARPADFPGPIRVKMLLLNLLPLSHVALLCAVSLMDIPVSQRLIALGVLLYLVPPLAVRVLTAWRGVPEGRIRPDSPDFLVWWATAQMQVLFNRFPMFEELLRLVPGLYSAWLRLWGARIGRLTFWAPGVAIFDRGYLAIGADVVFGAGVRLNGHVLWRGVDGQPELVLAPIRIGDGTSIGGYGLLTAGTEIAAGETTRACLALPPFTVWREGRRWRGETAEADELQR